MSRTRSHGDSGLTSDPWGDPLLPHPEHTVRVALLNVGGLPTSNQDEQNQLLRHTLLEIQPNIIGLTETNCNWSSIPATDRPHNRFQGWWESFHQISSHNRTENQYSQPWLPGGTTLIATHQMASRIQDKTTDPTSLGRWSSIHLRGCQGISLRIITAYRPTKNTGPLSTYQQHRRYLYDHDNDTDPLIQFNLDISQAVRTSLQQGEQLVLLLDANEDVRQGPFADAMNELGLSELCTSSHGLDGPPTLSWGSKPIDGIFVTPSLLQVRNGYGPFGLAYRTDHRYLWLDIPHHIAFGHKPASVRPFSVRCLKTRDPRTRQRYISLYKDFLAAHDVSQRLQHLHQRNLGPLSSWEIEEYEALDRLRTQGMLHAEKHCRKLRMGATAWTPDYLHIHNMLLLWRLYIKKLQRAKVSSKYYRRLKKKTGFNIPSDTTLEDALQARQHWVLVWKAYRQNSVQRRATWQQGLAEARSLEGNTHMEQELRRICHDEHIRRCSRLVRHALGNQRGCLTSVIGPHPTDDGRQEHTDVCGMEDTMMAENTRRFSQASDTPFLQPDLLSTFGPIGDTSAADQTLAGQYVPPTHTDHATVLLLQSLQQPCPDIPIHELLYDPDTYRRSWRQARKRTSSGPSGLHFGHFMANTYDDDLSYLDFLSASLPFISGYAPQRWQSGINVMLEKEKGNFNVERLRTILLLEADFNHNNKWIGKQLMRYAERRQLLAPEQYGSRKRHQAVHHCLNKQLTFDISCQLLQPLVLCSNDAKSCYDRIVHSVATLAMRRIGFPSAPILCMFTCLQQLRHFVRTVYGDSKRSFSGALWAVPLHGVGQGNGAAPAIWAVVSTPLLDIVRQQGHGVVFKTSISNNTLHFAGYTFVDDTDLCNTQPSLCSTSELTQQTQEFVDLWEATLRATGGALVPRKSYWSLVTYSWNDGRWYYEHSKDCPHTLSIKDHTGERKTLRRLQPHEAERALGVCIAPDGNTLPQLTQMLKQGTKWADHIRHGRLDRATAWQALRWTILKTLQYPLPATCLTEPECNHVMKPVLDAALPASGINRHMPHAIVYGPTSLGGLGIPNLYVAQGVAHVERIHMFCHGSDITGTLLRTSMEALKLELGLPGPLFSQPYEYLQHLATASWVKHTWKFCSQFHIDIQDDLPDLPLLRQQDKYLTHLFLLYTQRPSVLQALQRCRKYLQVTTIAELCDGNGTHISAHIRDHQRGPAITPYRWPPQPSPPATDWYHWDNCLQDTLLHTAGRLPQPLGSWTQSLPLPWYYHPTSDQIYERQQDGWCVWQRLSTRTRRKKYHRPQPCNAPTLSILQPATVTNHLTHILLTGHSPLHIPHPAPRPTWSEHIAQLPDNKSWALHPQCDNYSRLAHAFRTQRMLGVSDGSYRDNFATAAWGITAPDESVQVSGHNIVPGEPKDHDPYRGELSGIFGQMLFAHEFCLYHNITTAQMTVACDGLSALERSLIWDNDPTPLHPDYDLSMAIRHLRSVSPVQFHPQHVLGHQDSHLPFATLSLPARMNVLMDNEAKAHWHGHYAQYHSSPIAFEPWPISIAGHKITGRLSKTLADSINKERVLHYWNKPSKLSGQAHLVDWKHYGQALSSFPVTRQHHFIKFLTGFCAVGISMVRWGFSQEARCPRCLHPDETNTHVLNCPDARVQEKWHQFLSTLETWLSRKTTHPVLQQAILNGLRAWLTNSTTPSTHPWPVPHQALGWHRVAMGLCPLTWVTMQQHHYDSLGLSNTGSRWLIALICKLLDNAWDLWEHRNGILHNSATALRKIEIHRQVQQLWLHPPTNLLPQDAHLFQDHTIQTARTHIQLAWISSVRAPKTRSQRRLACARARSLLLQWLH